MEAIILEHQGPLQIGDIVELWPKLIDIKGEFIKIGETGSMYIRYGYLVLPNDEEEQNEAT